MVLALPGLSLRGLSPWRLWQTGLKEGGHYLREKLVMKIDKTIGTAAKDGLYTSCGTCVGMCTEGAMEIVHNDSRGMHIPRLDEEKYN